MTGSTQEDYAEMMLDGGRHVEGNRSRTGADRPAKLLAENPVAKPKPKAKAKSKAKLVAKAKSKPAAAKSSRSQGKSKSKAKSKSSARRK